MMNMQKWFKNRWGRTSQLYFAHANSNWCSQENGGYPKSSSMDENGMFNCREQLAKGWSRPNHGFPIFLAEDLL